MRKDIIFMGILIAFYVLITWGILLISLGRVKKTKRVLERHPYFTYPWYKRLFFLGLNKHRYLFIFALLIHITHFIFYITLIIDFFIFKKFTVISRIGAGFEMFNMWLMGLFLVIVSKNNKKGWKFNK